MLHSDSDKTKIRRETATPSTDPRFSGEAYFEDNASTAIGRCLRVAIDTTDPTDFVVAGFIPQQSSGDPNGGVTSRCARDLCVDIVNNRMYYAPSAASTSWTVLA